MFFVGLIDLTKKSIVLALLAGITQFIQAHIMAANMAPQSKEPSFANDLAKSMTFQTKYILPIFITFVSYAASSAIALYWVTSNVFSICQELYVRRKYKDLK
jgi:YidC/Oxa1 family membrane protein insertase